MTSPVVQTPSTAPSAAPSAPAKKNRRKWPWVLAAVFGLLVIIGMANSPAQPGGSSPNTQPATQGASPATGTDVTDPPAARDACVARPPAGDILLREAWPGLPVNAMQLGGQWQWNYTTHTCMNAVDMAIATAPLGSNGKAICTEVALAADNPGYNVEAKPAPRLNKVIASVCR